MTAQILAAELGNLIQDSKRKNTELRNASEKALQELKSLPVTSETQFSADLTKRPNFISPFLIACNTHNAKFASTAISCLQRLTVSQALPKERLTEVLDALKDSLSLSHDVQLKILQALPSLLQNYASEIRGDLLSTTLQMCSTLQNAKNFAVSNTAAATLQQLVIVVFDKVSYEDEKELETPTVTEVPGDSRPISVRPAAHDAFKVFNDLNHLVTGEKPTFIKFAPIPSTSSLELIEAILSNHGKIMTTHVEQIEVLRSLLMPTIIRSLSDRLSFPITLRIMRIVNLILRNHLRMLPSECEIALGLLNHMLDPEASPLWKRTLCLEVFRGIYSDSRLMLEIYSYFDEHKGKKSIFSDNLAAFVRLATEKPTLIGLGHQSTVPTSQGNNKETGSEQAVAEAGALAGVIGGPMADTNSNSYPTGISTQWSVLKTPCLEHLDKSEPPTLPDTYVYSLVLTCITNVSESLAKFILPLTVHHEGRGRRKGKTDDRTKPEPDDASSSPPKRRLSRTQSFRKKTIPVNPLTVTEHSAYDQVQTSSLLVTECWPAVLATCSTFLNAALDGDYYRSLVRAIQKFTQVAGLLRLSTPRDAFLTTLGKAALPSNLLLANISSPKSPSSDSQGVFSNTKGLLSVDSLVNHASSISLDKSRRASLDASSPTLGPRNLLCLRALLNLAIALGPTLQGAWSIVFETLQVADLVMALSNQSVSRTSASTAKRSDAGQSSEKVEAETAAVQAAARRLFESTVDFPNESFVEVLQALCTLLNTGSINSTKSGEQIPTNSGRAQPLHQRRLGSVSGVPLSTESNSRDSAFALNKIGELAALNEERLAHFEPMDSGWNIFIAQLVLFSADHSKLASTRLLAADIISRTVKEIAEFSTTDEQRDEIQPRMLAALQTQISALYQDDNEDVDRYSETDIRVHQVALEAFKNVIEQCGESLVAGWVSVFDSLLSVFVSQESSVVESGQETPTNETYQHLRPIEAIARSLARSAFGTVQLICSDFLAAVPSTCLATLLELLLKFCSQQEDLNMSLTAVTFFWNISDFLHSRCDIATLPETIRNTQQGDLRDVIDRRSKEGDIPALWLSVLVDLSAATTDKRAELRNSAIQTIQRIFENYVDQLSSDTWMLCLRTVLFGMVRSNLAVQNAIRAEPGVTTEAITAWNETTKAVLESVSILSSMCMDKIEDAAGLGDAWSDLLDYLQQYYHSGSHALGSSVFKTMTHVLARIDDSKRLGPQSILKTASVWKDYFNYRENWEGQNEENQEAFVAYAEAFKAIYQLTDEAFDAELPSMLTNLEACIVNSDEVAYSSDIDHMTALQSRVIECLSMARTNSQNLPPFLIQMLSRFSVLPYTILSNTPDRRGPTFVALSKESMTLLQTITIKHIKEEAVYTSGAILSTLSNLAKPIQEKYIWRYEGKPPTLWQKATTTVLAIMEPALPLITSKKVSKEHMKAIWVQIIHIAYFITRAQISTTSPTLSKDESFDIDAFTQLRLIITTPLGSPSISDSLRRTYTRNLFSTSVIHPLRPDEVPDPTGAPLEDLYKIRLGQTADPDPNFREKMAYVCLTELLSLISAHESSPSRIKLAQAAAPYLILRAALPLRAYIADQPLRGRMPAPASQRKELLFILEGMAKLESEPAAIPDAPGVTSTHRKHLHRLHPLLLKAMRVARRDEEVFDRLVDLSDLIGEEFGLEDD